MSPPARDRGRPQIYVLLFGLCAALLFLLHAQWLRLPYFWDEVGYYVPAALDVYHRGALIPVSVPPIMHPPGVMAYVAAVWHVAGFHLACTRVAMLAIASLGLTSAFLLAVELSKEAQGFPAILAAALLAVSPLFVSQAILVQLDMPAMALTTLALLLFLRERVRLSAAVCVALVLTKETGVLVPIVFAAWLAAEKRWREAAWFSAPVLVLAAWVAWLLWKTGHWSGTSGFADYNLTYPLHPVRLAANLLRRIYYLGFANLHWVGLIAMIVAWRRTPLFRSRPWRVAGSVALGHAALVTLLGGAALERYLLPSMPVVYAAMAAALSLLPRTRRLAMSGALLAGVAAGNFINPPYPFPYEDNVSFAAFAQTQKDAAETLDVWTPGARVATAWPLTGAITRPELGFVHAAYPTPAELPDFSAATLHRVDWSRVDVFVAFSRDWDPQTSLIHAPGIESVWRKFFGYVPAASRHEIALLVPYPLAFALRRGDQWADIYVNPRAVFEQRPRLAER